MTLTLGHGPLSGAPADRNFAIDGPQHRLVFEEHPRRIRALFGGRTVLDTVRGRLLHETGILPVLYAPLEDLDASALEATDHSTHCPFKGDASYRSVRVGGRVAENAVWTYPEPTDAAPWLSGYAALYFERMDAWLEEDEPVEAHLRDPYHRVDARPSSRAVEVTAGDDVLVSTEDAVLVFETGLPTRAYVPREAVRGELERSATTSHCPYKGQATYWSVRLGDRLLEDAAWGYEEPLDGASALRGLVSFDHDELEVRIAAR